MSALRIITGMTADEFAAPWGAAAAQHPARRASRSGEPNLAGPAWSCATSGGRFQPWRDRLGRLADHVGVLIEQHPPDDLLDRHPVGTGHRWRPPFIDSWNSRRS
jgi:hypothetical protein